MTKYGEYDGVPGVRIDTSAPENTSVGSSKEFIHLDDSDAVDEYTIYTIYIYTDEGRRDELAETINDLREEFILATGITFPPWMRDEMPLETDVLLAFEWATAFGGTLSPETLELVQNELESQREEDNDGE